MKNPKVLWITRTAVLLALLVVLQAVTKPLGQLVTGSCVNAVLAVAALLGGMGCGTVIALVSPVLAFLLGIAPQAVTVPAIMVGNTVFAAALAFARNREKGQKIAVWLIAAVAKFATLYLLVVKLICGVLAPALLDGGMLKEPMLKALPTMFAWPQLITALIGGGLALAIFPLLKKGIRF